MNENIAYCGLNCEECPANIAKQTNDQELREKTAKAWSGPGFTVDYQCGVRNCATEKGVNTCADCGDYPCDDKLQALWKQLNSPDAKKTLDTLRA
ncbi:MAG: DUF3795 domain-containing protein [Candidatus Hodarchaeales archaeon]|jgi:hypothetical protein